MHSRQYLLFILFLHMPTLKQCGRHMAWFLTLLIKLLCTYLAYVKDICVIGETFNGQK